MSASQQDPAGPADSPHREQSLNEKTGEPHLLAAIERQAGAFSGEFGLFAKNLASGETIGYRADAVMPTASVIKICVLCELYRQAGSGLIDLSERREVMAEDWWGGSGVLKEFVPGLTPTVADLARMMIIVSDNVATGMLVRLLGKDHINETMRSWGLRHTELVWNHQPGGDMRDYAVATSRELARLLELIVTDAVLTPEACAAIRDHLSRQQYLDQIPRFLPYNPYAAYVGATQLVTVANKTGFYPGIRADAAIVSAGDVTFVIATMTEKSRDSSFSPDHEGVVLNGRVARLVYEAWTGNGVSL
jgi:beta-lactamase class A